MGFYFYPKQIKLQCYVIYVVKISVYNTIACEFFCWLNNMTKHLKKKKKKEIFSGILRGINKGSSNNS